MTGCGGAGEHAPCSRRRDPQGAGTLSRTAENRVGMWQSSARRLGHSSSRPREAADRTMGMMLLGSAGCARHRPAASTFCKRRIHRKASCVCAVFWRLRGVKRTHALRNCRIPTTSYPCVGSLRSASVGSCGWQGTSSGQPGDCCVPRGGAARKRIPLADRRALPGRRADDRATEVLHRHSDAA